MEDKEILAQLKQCYELFEDVIENTTDKQLKDRKDLRNMQDILSAKYEEIYEKIKNENDISLYYEENIKIAPYIYYDYINENNEYITTGDLNGQKWYKDKKFIKEF